MSPAELELQGAALTSGREEPQNLVTSAKSACAVQRFPATAGGHRFIVPVCALALLCLVVVL